MEICTRPLATLPADPIFGLNSPVSAHNDAPVSKTSISIASKPKVSTPGRFRDIAASPTATALKDNAPVRTGSRRRAAVACVRCRARRLRCNMTETLPCARCRWDDADCVLQDCHKRKNIVIPNRKPINTPSPPSMPVAVIPMVVERDIGMGWRMTATVTKATDIYNLPAFIRPLPLSIDSEDVTYLQEKGALALPPPQLRNALLHAYVNYVHPYLPVLDIHNFLAIINADNHDFGHTSLLLFQAVMFSAAAFVEIEHLHNAGYADRKSARHALFQKTKLLYEFDYESDRLVVVQSLLLMTYWQKMPNDNKDMWHWLGIAISVAETIGLQREPVTAGGSPRQQRLRKRIWWCCAMRDHLLALGMRQPSRIQAKQREIQMLQVSDFEIELLPDEITILPAEGVCLRDIAVQQELAALCVAKVQLCVCIGNMIAVQYPPAVQNRDFGYNTTESAMKLSPRTELNAENIRHFDTQLLAWVDSLSPACQYRSLTPLDIMHGRDVVALHRTMLHMLFYTTMSALHRPQLLLPESSVPISQRPIRDFSQVRVRMAAQCVSRMANELQTLGLDKYLPATGVTVILFAMIINLQDMKNSVRSVRHTGRRCFYECLRVLEKLRNVYDNADWATAILDAALSTSGAYIDPQSGFIQQSAPSPNHFQKSRQDVSPGPRQDNPFASMVPWQDDFQWLTDSASSLPVSATENMNSSPASSTPDIETTFHLPESLSTGPLQDLEEIDWSVVLEDLTEADHGCKLFDELKPGPSEI